MVARDRKAMLEEQDISVPEMLEVMVLELADIAEKQMDGALKELHKLSNNEPIDLEAAIEQFELAAQAIHAHAVVDEEGHLHDQVPPRLRPLPPPDRSPKSVHIRFGRSEFPASWRHRIVLLHLTRKYHETYTHSHKDECENITCTLLSHNNDKRKTCIWIRVSQLTPIGSGQIQRSPIFRLDLECRSGVGHALCVALSEGKVAA